MPSFRRVPAEPDVWEEAERQLIDLGADEEKVRGAGRALRGVVRQVGARRAAAAKQGALRREKR